MSDEQDQRMSEILLRLSLLPHGATQAWNPSGGHSGEPDDRAVSQAARPDPMTHAAFAQRYARVRTDPAREDVIRDAQHTLDLLSRTRDWMNLQDAPCITDEQIILVDAVGWEPEAVAQHYRMLARHVRKIRQAAGVSTETGYPLEAVVLDIGEKRARARELRARGLSIKQIAMILGIGVGSAHRYLSGEQVN